jgi:hypothetical protein
MIGKKLSGGNGFFGGEKNGRKILEKAGNDLALFFGPRYSRIRGD